MSIVNLMFCRARPDRQFKEVQELIGLIDGMDKHTDGKDIFRFMVFNTMLFFGK